MSTHVDDEKTKKETSPRRDIDCLGLLEIMTPLEALSSLFNSRFQSVSRLAEETGDKDEQNQNKIDAHLFKMCLEAVRVDLLLAKSGE